MKTLKIIGLPLAVVLIVSMLLAALMPAGALAQKSGPTDVATTTGPKLWQVKEAPAYVPVARDDTGMYRSVRMPPVELVKNMLADNGAIPLDTSPG